MTLVTFSDKSISINDKTVEISPKVFETLVNLIGEKNVTMGLIQDGKRIDIIFDEVGVRVDHVDAYITFTHGFINKIYNLMR